MLIFSLKKASRKIVPLALAMAGTQFLNVASGFLCIIMLAHLGHQVLAASALMISTQVTIMVIGMSILFTMSLLIGHAYGAKNFSAIGNLLRQGWMLALIISTITILIFWFIGSILRFFNQSPDLIPLVVQYAHAYVWAVLPFQLAVCNQQLCYGVHQQRLAIISSFCSVTALLISAYILIFGRFGAPALGIKGLGYAVAIQGWIGFFVLNILMHQRDIFRRFDVFQFKSHQWNSLKQIFKIGWPMSFQMTIEMLSFFAFAMMVGWIGANALAATQVVNQYVFLTVVPVFALSQACGITVGQAKGAGDLHEVKNLGYAGMRIALSWALIASVFFITCPKILASLYFDTSDPANAQTLRWVIWLFIIAAVSQTFDALRNTMTGALRGLFDTRFPMYVGFIALWLVGIPLAYLLAFVLHVGILGIALGSAAGMMTGALIILYRWQKLSDSHSQIQ